MAKIAAQLGATPPSLNATQTAVTAIAHAQLTDGNVFYVDSNADGAGNGGKSPSDAFATLELAKGACVAGDTVIVLEGHTESITGATTWVPNVAGVKWIGLGRGARRPTLTFTATDSEVPIAGAGVEIHNFLVTISGTIDVVVGFTPGAVDILLQDIEMREAAIDDQFVDAIQGASCARLQVRGYKFVGATASDQATQSAINITDSSPEIEIVDYNLLGSFAEGAIEVSTVIDLYIGHGRIEQRHTTRDECIRLATTTTGFIEGARLRTATDDTAGMDAISGDHDMQLYDIGIVNADAEIATMDHTDLFRTDNTATTNYPFDASMV